MERHRQPAAHRLSDARQPADERAGGAGALGGGRASTRASARPAAAPRASSCTTVRRTPTATSTSAPPSTRSSRTSSSSRGRWPGFDAPYVPGWDCHGLPIELKVDRELGPKKAQMSVADFRRACRAYAARFVDQMRVDFKRLGVLGDWAEPYLTMNYGYQAAIVRALGKFVEQGLVYKGKKPVHWCTHCRTALAEAEVEYEDHTSPSIYVEFPLHPSARGRPRRRASRRWPAARSRCSSGRRRRGPSRPTWPSPSTRTSTTAPTSSTGAW